MRISRRDLILSGLGLGAALTANPAMARAYFAAGSTMSVVPAGGSIDQTAELQQAIDAASSRGAPLFLPQGVYSTRRLTLRSATHLVGVPGKTILRYRCGGGLIGVAQAQDVRLDGLVLDGDGKDMGLDGALLAATDVECLHLLRCCFLRSGSGGILVSRSDAVVVAGNIIDQAASGIAVVGGAEHARQAVVEGNVVRNLFFRKLALAHGNGISVDTDAVVAGNLVENAPGFGVLVGGDARDVSVTDNRIRNAHIAIGLPLGIADTALVAGNAISGVKDGAIRAMNGPTPIGPDLAATS